MSAEVVKAMLRAAAQQLDETRVKVIHAKSQVTDTGVYLNTGVSANKSAIREQLDAIRLLRDAITTIQSALIGTQNADASESLVWLNKVDTDLADDAVKLNLMQEKIQEVSTRVAEITRNYDEAIPAISNVMTRLRAHANLL